MNLYTYISIIIKVLSLSIRLGIRSRSRYIRSRCIRFGCIMSGCIMSGYVGSGCVRFGFVRSGYDNWLWVCVVSVQIGYGRASYVPVYPPFLQLRLSNL